MSVKEILEAEIIILQSRLASIEVYTLNKDFQLECRCLRAQIDFLKNAINEKEDKED